MDLLAAATHSLEVWDIHPFQQPREDSPLLDIDGVDYVFMTGQATFNRACRSLTSRDVILAMNGMLEGQAISHHVLRESLLGSPAQVGAVSAGTRPAEISDPKLTTVGGRAKRAARELIAGRISARYVAKRSRQIVTSARFAPSAERRALQWSWTGPDPTVIDTQVLDAQTLQRRLHTWDFDSELRAPATTQERRGLILVESMGPLHPDFAILDLKTLVPSRDWFNLIVAQCQELERALGQPLRVAAHPRAPEGSLDQWYAPFEVVYENTRPLVRNAQLVVAAEPSTALGLCALYRTPTAAIKSPVLYPGHDGQMDAYRRELGIPVIDPVAGNLDLHRLLLPPANADGFTNAYLAAPSSGHRPFWETVLADIM